MGNAASSLPYTIGRELSQLPDGWVLHEGARKADSLPVCVFTAKKPVLAKTPVDQRSSPQFSQLAPALQHFTNCRKLRHPQILSVHATLDTDHVQETSSSVNSSSSSHSLAQIATEQGDWLIVTEPCIPLAQWLATNPPLEQRAWGLECVIRAVHFLHASAQLSHGYLCPQALFVTPAGDVKVWSFGLATTVDATTGLSPTFVDYDALLMPQLYRSPERVEQRYKELAQTQAVHAMDAYSIGVLVSYFFDNHIPPPLVKAVQRLQTPNIRMRPRLQPLLKCPVFDTPYQKLQLQLEGFAMLAVEEKIQFWQTLLPQLQAQLLAAEVVKYKLWSMMTQAIVTVCTNDALKQQDLYRKEVLTILPPFFYVAQTYLDTALVNKELGAIVGLLFQVNDRGIRGHLLQKTQLLVVYLNAHTLNQAVFEPMCSGFSDSSAALRELTLKTTLVLLPQLTPVNLEKLSRYLIRLQGDPEAPIRTNTMIYFGKLAPHLTDIGRNKLLLPAFCRAMKDPFTPCRLEALRFAKTVKQYFDPPSMATKVLPAVTPFLLDPNADVRRECFQLVDELLFMIRQVGQAMGTTTTEEPNNVHQAPSEPMVHQQANVVPHATQPAPAAASGPTVPEAPSSGGYLSGLSSWMTSSAKPTTEPHHQQQTPAQAPPMPQQAPMKATVSAPLPTSQLKSLTLMEGNGNDDGWGDEDDNDDDDDGWGDDSDVLNESSSGSHKPGNSQTGKSLFAMPMQDEDDLFSSMDMKPTTGARPFKGVANKPSGKLVVPKKTTVGTKPVAPKVAVTKLVVDEDSVDDGWDDF